VHDSVKEVNDLALDFLTAFSQQLDPLYVVRNFSTNCQGRSDELSDTQHNQVDLRILSYHFGAPDTQALFTGRCPFPDPLRRIQGDACANVPAEWHSLVKAATYHPDLQTHIGQTMNVVGTDVVSAVLENDQWKLCGSNWAQTSATYTSIDGRTTTPTSMRFKR
jgi:hypothetical protein